jgi:hypothetical protein
MGYRPLDYEILNQLHRLTGLTEGTIRKEISILRRRYASLPINTVAQIFAVQRGFSVVRKLTSVERAALPNLEIGKPLRTKEVAKKQKSRRIIKFVKYETTNTFIKGHVTETNKAYTSGCYTAAFILCRKIIENLLTDIIRRKYPSNKKENVEIYFDTRRGRTRDFSEILKNLRQHSKDFGPDEVLLERIIQQSDRFRDDANNKTHSWYHLVRNKKELDDTNIQDIIDMIVLLERYH